MAVASEMMTAGGAARCDARFSRPRSLVFGIGAAKCGTSWLNALLRSHPKMHVAHQRELHYWDVVRAPFHTGPRDSIRRKLAEMEKQSFWRRRVLRAPTYRYYRAAARMHHGHDARHAAYADVMFSGYRRQPVVGEVTPAYALLQTETYAEMASLNPDTRFIYLMRDPMERLHSACRHELRKRHGHSAVSEANVVAMLKETIRENGGALPPRSQYDRTISRLEAAVPADRIHYEFFETLFTREGVARIFGFLGLPSVEASFDARNVGEGTGGISRAFVEVSRSPLAPVYDFIQKKFGEVVPKAWGRSGGWDAPQRAGASTDERAPA
ncbi:sulfotransferase [Tropicimonas sediminicola]|uniref:Sulfotransferase family protein n=1 Tax=Tropicimonas sediminicola TaxID=1031541 RepID=A0A239HGN0_9RHOB|nr:sulfotransferase [Tropicimonas sediminicola]SNS80490.1 Sulfotransferase family protein [Tropicimonas sediminicola]